jgi:hypothetical protein
MLITVRQTKLVLGRTVYHRGDVFECRDAEAKLLIAGKMVTKSAEDAKATKGAPTAPTTGMSSKPGTLKGSRETPAPSVGRAKRIPTLTSSVAPAPLSTAPEAKPVGAMTTTDEPALMRVTTSPAITPKA